MGAKKPKIVIIGAGMAGLTAAHKLHTCTAAVDLFDLSVVEGGSRIGGRIHTSEFGGDRIETGATWIHGIGGSPVYQIAQEIGSLVSDQPWECMDGFLDGGRTAAEGGFDVNPDIVEKVSTFFTALMDLAQGRAVNGTTTTSHEETEHHREIAAKALKVISASCCGSNNVSVGSFLRQGLQLYLESSSEQKDDEVVGGGDSWTRKLLEEAVFAVHENIQRTYTSAGDLHDLDFNAESEYVMFPGEEITIAKGYSSVVESLAAHLPDGMIRLGKRVKKIEWRPESSRNGFSDQPVKLHFWDGSVINADHVIVTVSLGVLKDGIRENAEPGSGLFYPPLPDFKKEAISRLGFGVVNKLFLELGDPNKKKKKKKEEFPFLLQMAFHGPESEWRSRKVPGWMRRTASIAPIYGESKVLLSWFAGEEALELESLDDEEIIEGVSRTVSCLLNSSDSDDEKVRFTRVYRSKWGTDPLFLGSYSYVRVGSRGEDLDAMAEPLPRKVAAASAEVNVMLQPLQILFAGEATHRTHYSTTHGAYYSGLREANRLLQHYHSA